MQRMMLAVLALAWLQLSTASHQFDHVADYVSETCHVCVHLDRVDDVTIDHSQAPAVAVLPGQSPAGSDNNAIPKAVQTAFNPRAPPRL